MINSFDYRGYIVTGFPVFGKLYKTLFELLQNESELRNCIKTKTVIQIDDSFKIKIKKFGINMTDAIGPNFHFLVYSKRLKEKIKNYFKPNKHTNFYSYVNIEFVSNNAKAPIHISDADKIVYEFPANDKMTVMFLQPEGFAISSFENFEHYENVLKLLIV